MVSKVLEKLVNNRTVDQQEKCDLFSDFQYGFRSSGSTPDLLIFVSDRIVRAFNRSGATLAFDISKAFDRVWHAVFLVLFCLFSVIDGFEWFRMARLLSWLYSFPTIH